MGQMETFEENPDWLRPLTEGTHACFFYTTPSEFFSIAAPYFHAAFTSMKERTLWILPPHFTFQRAVAELQAFFNCDLETLMEMRRLVIIPWEKWYGTEISIRKMVQRHLKILKETLRDGFETLRVLSHSPAKSSPYWKDFLLYEESASRGAKTKPLISLCGYSLIDCPAAAISPIAANHSLCLIHHGEEWHWLSTPASNLLQSFSVGYKHPR